MVYLSLNNDGSSNVVISMRAIRMILLVSVLSAVAIFQLGETFSMARSDEDPQDKTNKSSVGGKWSVGGLGKKKTPKEHVGMLEQERLETIEDAASALIEMLEDYYGGTDQASRMLMTHGWANPWDFGDRENTTDVNNTARSDKLVDTMARALVDEEQDRFIIGVIGSSVAAGHDNCNYDSYERQLERTLSPVWQAAGMTLEVQNAGEGGGCGDSHENQVYCIKQLVSPFSDIIHYVWTYFEGKTSGPPARENLVRWAQMLKRQPPVHAFHARGGKLCPHNNIKPDEAKIWSTYAKYGYNTLCLQTALIAGGYDYEAAKKNNKTHFGWKYQGDGYHMTTRYGEHENTTRRESLGVVFRNWHPGPLGFQIVADSFAYTYANSMLRAVDLIRSKVGAGEDPRDTYTMERPILLKDDLPEPELCDPLYCKVDDCPSCLSFEKPTYGWWGARVDDPDDDLNPHRGQLQNWSIWTQANGNWKMVDKQDIQVYKENPGFCKHLDACGGIQGKSPEDGMVVFKLPKMEVGLVVICGCCGKNGAKSMFMENEFVEVRYNNVLLSNTTWDIFPNPKCVRLLSRFPADAPTTTGHLYLSIKILEGIKEPVSISQVITL